MIGELKVGGHRYSVLYPYLFKERTDLYGQCDSALCELRISGVDGCGNPRSRSNILATLLHEIIHAVDNSSGLCRLGGNQRENEELVEALAQGFLQVFTDNPDLLKEFLE